LSADFDPPIPAALKALDAVGPSAQLGRIRRPVVLDLVGVPAQIVRVDSVP
jgi:hypothetical protein